MRRLESALKSSNGDSLDSITAGWYSEYLYRTLFPGVTHDHYLDSITVEERNWMLRIHQLVKKQESNSE